MASIKETVQSVSEKIRNIYTSSSDDSSSRNITSRQAIIFDYIHGVEDRMPSVMERAMKEVEQKTEDKEVKKQEQKPTEQKTQSSQTSQTTSTPSSAKTESSAKKREDDLIRDVLKSTPEVPNPEVQIPAKPWGAIA